MTLNSRVRVSQERPDASPSTTERRPPLRQVQLLETYDSRIEKRDFLAYSRRQRDAEPPIEYDV